MRELDRHITGNNGHNHPDNAPSKQHTAPDCFHCGKEEYGEYIYLGEYYCEDCLLEEIFERVIVHIENQVFGEDGQNGIWSIESDIRTDQVTGITFFSKHVPIFSQIEFTIPIDHLTKLFAELNNAK